MEAPSSHSHPVFVRDATVDSAGGGDGVNHGDLFSLYVTDLDLSVTDSQLYEYFTSVSHVVSASVCRTAATNTSLGYGYVTYNNRDDAEKALSKLNHTSLNGKMIRIDLNSHVSRETPFPPDDNSYDTIRQVVKAITYSTLTSGSDSPLSLMILQEFLDYDASLATVDETIEHDLDEDA